MPNVEKSAPGGRESAQENVSKPGHGANAQKNNHGQQGQAQQNQLAPHPNGHGFTTGDNE